MKFAVYLVFVVAVTVAAAAAVPVPPAAFSADYHVKCTAWRCPHDRIPTTGRMEVIRQSTWQGASMDDASLPGQRTVTYIGAEHRVTYVLDSDDDSVCMQESPRNPLLGVDSPLDWFHSPAAWHDAGTAAWAGVPDARHWSSVWYDEDQAVVYYDTYWTTDEAGNSLPLGGTYDWQQVRVGGSGRSRDNGADVVIELTQHQVGGVSPQRFLRPATTGACRDVSPSLFAQRFHAVYHIVYADEEGEEDKPLLEPTRADQVVDVWVDRVDSKYYADLAKSKFRIQGDVSNVAVSVYNGPDDVMATKYTDGQGCDQRHFKPYHDQFFAWHQFVFHVPFYAMHIGSDAQHACEVYQSHGSVYEPPRTACIRTATDRAAVWIKEKSSSWVRTMTLQEYTPGQPDPDVFATPC